MMSSLRIRLDVPHLDEGPKEYGVVANITPIPGEEKPSKMSSEDRKQLQGILIPAGNIWEDDPKFKWVELPPGRYYVEAVLPSEELVIDEVLVVDSPDPVELRLLAEESPHEWLSWLRFSGNVPALEQYSSWSDEATRGTISFIDVNLMRSISPPPVKKTDSAQYGETSNLTQGYFFSEKELIDKIVSNQTSFFISGSENDLLARVARVDQPYASDPASEVHFLDREISKSILGDNGIGERYRQDRFDRYYLFASGDEFPAQYSVLPIPWCMESRGGERMVQAMVLKAPTAESGFDGLDQGFRIATVVQDEKFGSLVGYLGAGRLPAASAVFSQAKNRLFKKYTNPIAAAAGGYVLLGNPTSEERDYWHGWIRNLMRSFPWLPDGAILHGRLLLRLSQEADQLAEARENFLEGARRGLPYYSKGVVYLLEGLARFKNDAARKGEADEEVETAHKLIQELALRTNMRQPFTTVLLD
jgi:hypothetical protein